MTADGDSESSLRSGSLLVGAGLLALAVAFSGIGGVTGIGAVPSILAVTVSVALLTAGAVLLVATRTD